MAHIQIPIVVTLDITEESKPLEIFIGVGGEDYGSVNLSELFESYEHGLDEAEYREGVMTAVRAMRVLADDVERKCNQAIKK